MKAAQISEYGGPSVIKINEVDKPVPGPGQILVKVMASSINPFDYKVRSGMKKEQITLQFPATLGGDIAGTVEALGDGVEGFAVGDKVYGQANVTAGNSGAFAEYAVTKAEQLAKMPANLDFVQAASLVLVGVSALQGITELINLQPGQKLLIQGGSGGIGTVAVEIAKHLGAYVATTVASGTADTVKALGADETIDYESENFIDLIHDYDAVFNTAGGDITPAFAVLKPGGIAVSMTGPGDEAAAKARGITTIGEGTQVNTDRLTKLAGLIEEGVVTPQVAKIFPLDRIVEAFQVKEQGGQTGKIAIEIS